MPVVNPRKVVWEAFLAEINGTQLPLRYTIPEHIKLARFYAWTSDIDKTGAVAGAARLSIINRAGQVRVAVPDPTVIPVLLSTRTSFAMSGATNLLVVDNIHQTTFPNMLCIGGDVVQFDMTNGLITDAVGPTLVTLEVVSLSSDLVGATIADFYG